MKISEKFREGKTLFGFELLPPLKGESIKSLFDTVERLMPFGPSYVNITYHRQETEYREAAGGLLERRTVRKRPGTVAIAAALNSRYGLEVVPHLICGGFSKSDTEDALIDLNFLGIDNVLALRGDNERGERMFRPANDGHTFAHDLVAQIGAMNRGEYLDPQMENAAPTAFCTGVAGYPEKHAEAPNLATDIAHLKAKVDAGAEYIVTQMFFDNSRYFDFVEKCRAAGIKVPIVAGLKPLTTARQLTLLPQTFGLELPQNLVERVLACGADTKAVREVGTQWTLEQSQELMAAGVPALHYYTMGRAENVAQIAKELF